MKYILTFIGGITVGLLTAMGIYAADEFDKEEEKHTIDGGEDTIIQDEIQADGGEDIHEDGIVEDYRSILSRQF
ncbi:MAG: hypothetical protein C4518_16230 [Desulfobacteraceae bacterium]|nr:MAG: hypothetical protein C4518_16230 [Desulfobacteraceae bacterium]